MSFILEIFRYENVIAPYQSNYISLRETMECILTRSPKIVYGSIVHVLFRQIAELYQRPFYHQLT